METTIGIKYHFLLCFINITSSRKKPGFFLNSSGDFMLLPCSLLRPHQTAGSKLPVVTVLGLCSLHGRPRGPLLLPSLLQNIFTNQSQNYGQWCNYKEEHQREHYMT